MPKIAIRIIKKGQPTVETVLNEKPGEEKKFKIGRLETAGILEKGMVSGKTSLMFHVITEDGSNIIVETSAAIIEGLYTALVGAEIAFKTNKL